MSGPLGAAPGVTLATTSRLESRFATGLGSGSAPGIASRVAPCGASGAALPAAHAVSHRLLVRFGAASHAPAMLRSHGWQSASRLTETIDEPRPRAARAPFLFAAAGLQ